MASPDKQKAPVRGPSGGAKQCSSTGNGTAALAAPASIELVVDRLERVRPNGKASFSARCPAHEDRTASLSVTEGTDGRILVHCFAGCSPHSILAAIGLNFADLFPRRLADATPEARRELQGLALRSKLRACADVVDLEARVILIAAGDLERGVVLADADHQRLAVACERIRDARVAIAGRQ